MYITYTFTLQKDGYRDQIIIIIVTSCSVCLCFPRHIHYSCSTVMALLCIPSFSSRHSPYTVYVCVLIVHGWLTLYLSSFPVLFPQSLYVLITCNCLHAFFTCIQPFSHYMYIIHDSSQTIALPTCSIKYTSKEGLELLLTMEL